MKTKVNYDDWVNEFNVDISAFTENLIANNHSLAEMNGEEDLYSVLEEASIFGSYKQPLQPLPGDFHGIKLFGSREFNDDILKKLFKGAKIFKKYENLINEAFQYDKGCYVATAQRSRLSYIFNKCVGKVLDIVFYDPSKSIYGLYDMEGKKLYIMISNFTTFTSVDDDKVISTIVHEMTHRALENDPDFIKYAVKDYYSFFKHFYVNICLYAANMIGEIGSDSISAAKESVIDDNDYKHELKSIVKVLYDNEKNVLKKSSWKFIKTFEDAHRKMIEFIGNKILKRIKDDDSVSKAKYKEIEEELVTTAFGAISSLCKTYFTSIERFLENYYNSRSGYLLFYSLADSYADAINDIYGPSAAKQFKAESTFLQELFFCSEISCIINQQIPDYRYNVIKGIFV